MSANYSWERRRLNPYTPTIHLSLSFLFSCYPLSLSPSFLFFLFGVFPSFSLSVSLFLLLPLLISRETECLHHNFYVPAFNKFLDLRSQLNTIFNFIVRFTNPNKDMEATTMMSTFLSPTATPLSLTTQCQDSIMDTRRRPRSGVRLCL